MFIKGYWLYAFGDPKKGKRIMNRALRILTDLKSFCVRNHLKKHYNAAIKNIPIIK
jgi:hypothetical protein